MSTNDPHSGDDDAPYQLAPEPKRREYTPSSSHQPDEDDAVVASSPLPSHLKSTLLAGVLVLLIGLPIWSYVSARMEVSRMKSDARLAEAAEKDHAQAISREAGLEVDRALANKDFSGATFALETATQKGIPGGKYTELSALISKRAFEERSRLVAEVESHRLRGELDAAQSVLREVRALDRYTISDQRRDACERLLDASVEAAQARRLKEETTRENGHAVAMLKSSRQAAGKRDWDKAFKLLEDARLESGDSADVITWQNELQDLVGGRLKIDSNVGRVRILIDGSPADLENGVIVGLPEGQIEVTVEADGYVPESRRFKVAFPRVTTGFVELIPDAPGPVWAASIAADPCARWLLRAYYAAHNEAGEPVRRLEASIQPCATESKSRLTMEELRDRVMYRLSRAKDAEKPLRERLGDLGELIARYPASTEILIAEPGFQSLLGDIAPQLEHACADCLGTGVRICAACDGRGRRKELRPCESCHSTGFKMHKECKGAGVLVCKLCKGQGSFRQNRRDCRGGLYPVRVVCSSCRGRKIQPCPGCIRGRVVCTACNGNRKQDRMGGCSACHGMSGWPCGTCGETGLRARMEPARRRKQERAAARLIAGG